MPASVIPFPALPMEVQREGGRREETDEIRVPISEQHLHIDACIKS